MSRYSVKLMPQAQKDLDSFSGKLLARFEKVIMGLYDEPRPRNAKKLIGTKSMYRIRVGSYRILYEVDDLKRVVKVYRVMHRKDAYKRR